MPRDGLLTAAVVVRVIVCAAAVPLAVTGVGYLWSQSQLGWPDGLPGVGGALLSMGMPWLSIASLTVIIRSYRPTKETQHGR